MSDFLNLPSAEQFDMQNVLLASIASNVGTGGISINNWEDVQRVVRMGLADKAFTVGDQFVANYNGAAIKWDVIGINHDKPSDPKYKNSLTIQSHDCIMDAQFSAAQAIGYTELGVPSGEQIFTFDGKQYKFTTVQAIPAKGQIVATAWEVDTYVPTKFSTYGADRTTIIDANLDVTLAVSGVDTILDVNNKERCKYGSNNYKESAIRQFLNSTETAFKFTPQTKFDRPSVNIPYGTGGFLKLLDPDLVNVLGKVDKQVSRNTVNESGGQDLFSDKLFLLTRTEVYGGTEGVTDGESPYEYYSSMSTTPISTGVDWRIKYLAVSPRNWWLRTPGTGSSYYTRIVCTSGDVNNSHAGSTYGVSPACVII